MAPIFTHLLLTPFPSSRPSSQLVRAGKLLSGPPAVQAVVTALHAAPELLVLVEHCRRI